MSWEIRGGTGEAAGCMGELGNQRRWDAWVRWEIRGGAGEAAGGMGELGDQRRGR